MGEVERLCNEYEKLEEMLKPLQEKQSQIKEAIKKSLQDSGKNEMTYGRVMVKRYATTKVSYPTKLLRKHLTPDLLAKVTETSVTETFRITIAKK